MPWYERGDVSPLLAVPRERIVCLDTETTGLNPQRDEVLQLALVRGDGAVLANELYGAERHARWPAAQRVHGIAPEMVQGRAPLRAHTAEVSTLLAPSGFLVGYNLRFDLAFLRAAGVVIPRVRTFDVMREVAPVFRRRSRDGKRAAWVRLVVCAGH